MDNFQLLAILVNATYGLGRGEVSIRLNGASHYTVSVDTISCTDVDPRVALREVVIALDEQLRSDACAALDGFGLVALAQKKRREAETFASRGSHFVAADLRCEAEKLEAEALAGRPL